MDPVWKTLLGFPHCFFLVVNNSQPENLVGTEELPHLLKLKIKEASLSQCLTSSRHSKENSYWWLKHKCHCAFSITEQGTPWNQACYQKEKSLNIVLLCHIKVQHGHRNFFKKQEKFVYKQIIFFYSLKYGFAKRTFIKTSFFKTKPTSYFSWHTSVQISLTSIDNISSPWDLYQILIFNTSPGLNWIPILP